MARHPIRSQLVFSGLLVIGALGQNVAYQIGGLNTPVWFAFIVLMLIGLIGTGWQTCRIYNRTMRK